MTYRPTPVDTFADNLTLQLSELSPLQATACGVPGFDHLMDDFSPAGVARQEETARRTLAEIDGLQPRNANDEVTIAAMRDRIGLTAEILAAGEAYADLNNIASPLQSIRDVFDIMPTATVEQWDTISQRLANLPAAIDGYIQTLREGIARSHMPARRQVSEGITQAEQLAAADSFFTTFTAQPGVELPAALRNDLATQAAGARAAYGRLAGFLREELFAAAPAADAVGRDRYSLWSRYFVGATVDLDETYEWGLAELDAIAREQEDVARKIAGEGASVADAVAVLDRDPKRQLHGTAALQEWMQATSDAALASLNGKRFTIPAELMKLECMIAPTQNGGIYYTGPSDDFSRPGRMWWSVPPGVTTFNTWREKTTVYHEGVPGHHLQIATAVLNKDQLNSWRRLMCWLSGHGEGWALYAEKLMAEFGYLDDLGDYFGLLDSQRLRATRVVLDLGVHLGKRAPATWGGGRWNADKAWNLLRRNVNMEEGFLRFELNRYLGWPGQAPSYKIGQRLWEEIRHEAGAVASLRGQEFSLRDFHSQALALGALPLDVLADVLTK